MLDPEDDPQEADPPEKTTGSGSGRRAKPNVELDSANALKQPLDPPENQGGGG